MSRDTSAAIEATIGCGKFQFLVYICYQWIVFAQAWNMVAMLFSKVQPTWTCLDEDASYNPILWNSSKDERAKQCAIRATCTNLTYSHSYHSFVAEVRFCVMRNAGYNKI